MTDHQSVQSIAHFAHQMCSSPLFFVATCHTGTSNSTFHRKSNTPKQGRLSHAKQLLPQHRLQSDLQISQRRQTQKQPLITQLHNLVTSKLRHNKTQSHTQCTLRSSALALTIQIIGSRLLSTTQDRRKNLLNVMCSFQHIVEAILAALSFVILVCNQLHHSFNGIVYCF